MRPETAKALVAQHRDELMHDTACSRRSSARRLFPRWHVSWTRAILAGRGSSLVIIITAHRSA
jgi:hypothetical protein